MMALLHSPAKGQPCQTLPSTVGRAVVLLPTLVSVSHLSSSFGVAVLSVQTSPSLHIAPVLSLFPKAFSSRHSFHPSPLLLLFLTIFSFIQICKIFWFRCHHRNRIHPPPRPSYRRTHLTMSWTRLARIREFSLSLKLIVSLSDEQSPPSALSSSPGSSLCLFNIHR